MAEAGNKKRILAVTTGGTIEKTYCESAGTIANRESLLKSKLMQKLRLPHTSLEVHELMAKDSLEMEDADRERIAAYLRENAERYDGVLVLHGTDTVDQTLKHCHRAMGEVAVPIVFTGAMKPAGFEDSDAMQNLAEAIFAAQHVAPGLYLSFHSRLFAAPSLRKNRERGTFEEVGE